MKIETKLLWIFALMISAITITSLGESNVEKYIKIVLFAFMVISGVIIFVKTSSKKWR